MQCTSKGLHNLSLEGNSCWGGFCHLQASSAGSSGDNFQMLPAHSARSTGPSSSHSALLPLSTSKVDASRSRKSPGVGEARLLSHSSLPLNSPLSSSALRLSLTSVGMRSSLPSLPFYLCLLGQCPVLLMVPIHSSYPFSPNKLTSL